MTTLSVGFAARLPLDIKQWLEECAARDASSQNSVIVRCLRDRMEQRAVERRESRDILAEAARNTAALPIPKEPGE